MTTWRAASATPGSASSNRERTRCSRDTADPKDRAVHPSPLVPPPRSRESGRPACRDRRRRGRHPPVPLQSNSPNRRLCRGRPAPVPVIKTLGLVVYQRDSLPEQRRLSELGGLWSPAADRVAGFFVSGVSIPNSLMRSRPRTSSRMSTAVVSAGSAYTMGAGTSNGAPTTAADNTPRSALLNSVRPRR